jgi:putative transposase
VPQTEPLPKTEQVIGIDVGLAHLYTSSDGEQVENPRWYRAAQQRLRVAQRRVARRKKGGKDRCKAVVMLQRQHERIANQRKDALNYPLWARSLGDHFDRNPRKQASKMV